MRALLAGLILGLLAWPAAAQAQALTAIQANYYNAGAASPLQTETFAASAAVCNQTPPTNPSTINPTRAVYADPANSGKDCIITDPAGGTLLSLPLGGQGGTNYEGTLTPINAVGPGPESARVPFSRGAAPAALTGVLFVR